MIKVLILLRLNVFMLAVFKKMEKLRKNHFLISLKKKHYFERLLQKDARYEGKYIAALFFFNAKSLFRAFKHF